MRKTAVAVIMNLQVLLLQVPAISAAAELEPPPPLALPNCQDKCGGVTIPHPFGIGANCSLNKWYEIDCQQQNGSSVQLATLKNMNGLIVLSISITTDSSNNGLNSIVEVLQPIFNSGPNCSIFYDGVNGPPAAANLTGSPYVYSQEKNVFLSIGCNNLAFMVNLSMEAAVVGCKSTCGTNRVDVHSDCMKGIRCCSNVMPFGMQAYSVDFRTLNDSAAVTGGSCRYAFVVERSWYDPKRTNLQDLQSWYVTNETNLQFFPGYVPVALEWGVSNETFANMSISSDPNKGGYRCTNSSSSYYGNYVPTPLVLVECRCAHGFSGNPYISGGCKDINECLSPDNHRCSGKCVNRRGGFNCVDRKVPAIIGASTGCGAILLFGFSWWFYKFIKKRREIKRKRRLFKRNGGVLLQQLLSYDDGNHVEKSKLFTSKELEKATDNFDENRVLGRGGQGTVYKGMLTDGNIVAIKKSKIIDEGKVEEFVNEVIILSQINHRNVVKLLGCCLETEVPLLVYEFIQNGTLYQYLHYPNEEFVVSWDVRLRIATEIAGALSYLHFSAAKPIYHRDIKSSNILLDYKYRAKIADFGTSRMVAIDQTHLTTIVQGTIGYLDPELLQTSQFTDKSDVYSFGVVLIELLTGQKPISSQRADAGRSLTAFFLTSMEDDLLFDIIDAGVLKQGKKEEMAGVANLARRCLNWCGRNRPTMKEVAIELERLRAQHLSPPDDVQQDQQLIKPESIQAWHDMTVMKMSKVETEPSSSEVESLLHITVPR